MSRHSRVLNNISAIDSDTIFRGISGFALGLGAACSVLALKNYYRYKKLRRGIKKEATVIEIRQGHKDHYVIPVLQFKTARNEEITVIGEWNTAGLALNDKIMISYDPNNPNNFIEVRELHKKSFLRALWIFSAMLIGCGTLGLLKYSPNARDTLHLINERVPRVPLLAFQKSHRDNLPRCPLYGKHCSEFITGDHPDEACVNNE